jgi:predicted molibdopterin-dependent oxidoreductase YjgC
VLSQLSYIPKTLDPARATQRASGRLRRIVTAAESRSRRPRSGFRCLTFHFPATGANAVTGPVRGRVTGCPQYKVTAVEVAPEG